jgi:hypothetical protein
MACQSIGTEASLTDSLGMTAPIRLWRRFRVRGKAMYRHGMTGLWESKEELTFRVMSGISTGTVCGEGHVMSWIATTRTSVSCHGTHGKRQMSRS